LSFAFVMLVLVSVTWSIHPDLTIRRGIGYIMTMLIAAYITQRFNVIDRMRVLSASFAVSAIGSFLFTLGFPSYGIMQDAGGLAGNWRGVFTTKEQMGEVMAAAVFTEVFLLVASRGRPRWRFALLGSYIALVVLAHAATCLLLTLAYLVGTGMYLLWQSDEVRAGHITAIAGVLLCAGLCAFWIDPAAALGVVGKDATLTGRTELWSALEQLIEQKPLLGWGYRAMFQSADASTALIDRYANFGATTSDNTFLELTLELGLVGACVMFMFVVSTVKRGLRCIKIGEGLLGWSSLVFVAGALVSGMTVETLAQNQNIEWVLFNILSLSCGLCIASLPERSGVYRAASSTGAVDANAICR